MYNDYDESEAPQLSEAEEYADHVAAIIECAADAPPIIWLPTLTTHWTESAERRLADDETLIDAMIQDRLERRWAA